MSNFISKNPGSMMDRFDNFVRDSFGNSRNFLTAETFSMDVKDNGKEYLVEADLPGIPKENVNVSIENGTLTISIERDESKEEKNEEGKYLHRERFYSTASRSVYLEDATKNEIPSAKMQDGVLTITVPKDENAVQSKKIEIL